MSQLKSAVLDKKLEEHHEANEWLSRGGGGKLHSKYKQRAQSNLGDPAVDKLNEQDMMKRLEADQQRLTEEKVRNACLQDMVMSLLPTMSPFLTSSKQPLLRLASLVARHTVKA